MNLPVIIDVALGLILVYLILSLLASEIQELTAAHTPKLLLDLLEVAVGFAPFMLSNLNIFFFLAYTPFQLTLPLWKKSIKGVIYLLRTDALTGT